MRTTGRTRDGGRDRLAVGRAPTLLAILACAALVAGCAGLTVRAAVPATSPVASPAASAPAQADPFVGKVVVTVTDDLVVRSQPRVADDSVIYRPYLPRGTELRVIDGPVKASGYTWYQVIPVSFVLTGRPANGWVAAAGKDGEPWIALPGTTPGPVVSRSRTSRVRRPTRRRRRPPRRRSTAFGVDLYRRLLADGVIGPRRVPCMSPTSIAFALGMTLAGAKGDTAAQMAKVLHTAGWDPFGQGLNSSTRRSQRGTRRGRTSTDPPTKIHALDLQLTNAAFAQQGWPIESAYLERIARALGVGLGSSTSSVTSTAARRTINAWVSARRRSGSRRSSARMT